LNTVTKRAIIKVKRTTYLLAVFLSHEKYRFSITVGEYSRYVVDKAHKPHKSDMYIEKYIDTIGDALKRTFISDFRPIIFEKMPISISLTVLKKNVKIIYYESYESFVFTKCMTCRLLPLLLNKRR
jgi:hypothetical protein